MRGPRSLAILLAAGVLALAATAGAHERIPLELGRVTDEELEAFKAYYLARAGIEAEWMVDAGKAATIDEAWQILRRFRMYIGRYDVDGDGERELIVFPYWACGTAGCSTVFFRRRDSRWEQWFTMTVSEPEYLCATTRTPGAPADLYSYTGGLWWNGTEYVGVCLDRCGEIDETYPPSEEELRLREQFHAYGECSQAPPASE